MHWVSEGFGAKIESLHFDLRAAEAHLWQGSGAVMMGKSVGSLCGDRLEGRGLETGVRPTEVWHQKPRIQYEGAGVDGTCKGSGKEPRSCPRSLLDGWAY